MKLRHLLVSIKTMRIPGMFSLVKELKSSVKIHFIHSALESGLLEALQQPCSRGDLIEKLNVKRPEILDALLDLGLSLGELVQQGDQYLIKGKLSRIASTNAMGAIPAMIQGQVTYYNSAHRNAAERMRGGPLGNDLEHIGDLVARCSKIGEPIYKSFLKENVVNLESARILDIGCGSGTFLKTAFEANPSVNGVGMDIDPSVVEQAAGNMESWNLGDKFKIVQGDIAGRPEEIKGSFDLITLFNVIYYFQVTDRTSVFSSIKNKLSKNGKLLILNSMRGAGRDWMTSNLNLVNSSLKGLTPLPDLELTSKQLRESGFNNIKTSRLMPGSEFYGITAS